jgi:peroxiredoxin Q/BCP
MTSNSASKIFHDSHHEDIMQVNDVVENFTLQNQDDKTVNLTDFKGKPVVLFFYPRADTPGCTIESCGFRDAFERFQKEGIVVLGISRDTVKAQKKFKDKYELPYDLLADPDMELINRLDLVKPKNMYGKLVKGVKRTTYLIGPDQRLIRIFEEVKPEGHAEEVFDYLKQHSSKK